MITNLSSIFQGSCSTAVDTRSINLTPQLNQTTLSVQQLLTQVLSLVSNVQSLVQNPIKNGLADVQLIGNIVKTITSFNRTNSKTSMNNTLQSLKQISTNFRNQVTGKGTSFSGCYNQTLGNLVGLAAYFVANMSTCVLTQATNGVAMISTDIAYVSNILNLVTSLPTSFSGCINNSNFTATYLCLKSLATTTLSTVVNAPVTVTNMVNNAYSYINLFPTTLTVCATNTTMAAGIDAAALGMNIVTCIFETAVGV